MPALAQSRVHICAIYRSANLLQVAASKSPERKGEGHIAEKLNMRGVEVYKQQQAMKYKDIEHLAFGFRHIVQIDHLEGLINLKKLQLDNNCLTKIENLGHLVCAMCILYATLLCVSHSISTVHNKQSVI